MYRVPKSLSRYCVLPPPYALAPDNYTAMNRPTARKGHSRLREDRVARVPLACEWKLSQPSCQSLGFQPSIPTQKGGHSIRPQSPMNERTGNGSQREKEPALLHQRAREECWFLAQVLSRCSRPCGPAVPFELGPCTVGMHLAQKVDVEELPS